MSTSNEQTTENKQNNKYEEETDQLDFTTVWEVFESLTYKLGREYKFIPSADGVFSSMDIYYRSTLDVPGLNIPKDFRYFKKLTTKDKGAYGVFRAQLQDTLQTMSDGASSHYKKLLMSISNSLLGRVADKRSELSMQAYSRIGDEQLFRTLSGKKDAAKILPQISWFPEQLQQLDARSLLSIFSQAEAEVLMLVLGKAMVGYNGCLTVEGEILTTARAYAIMVDTEGGLGKSTIMNYIRETMTKLGYKVTSVNTNGSRFGWGTVATADLSLIDDLTNEKLGSIISGNEIKQLVTNGTFQVEEKGQPAIEVRSVTTILGASNTTDPRHYFNMDGGSISRLNQLRTKSKAELADEFGHFQNGAIAEYWASVGDRFGVSREVLTMYLLARSAEMFMHYTGNVIEDGHIVHKQDTLMAKMDDLRSQLKIDPNFTYVDDLTKALAVFAAVCYSRSKDDPLTKADLKNKMRSLKLSPTIITEFISNYGLVLPEPLQAACRPSTLDPQSIDYAQQKVKELGNQKATKRYLEAFANTIGELSSTRGFSYPTTLSFYESSWSKAIEEAIGICNEIAACDIKQTTSSALFLAASKMFPKTT